MDTYLTPLKYDGWHAAFDYQRYQAMKFAPRDWTMRLSLNLSVDKTDNPARNASMWDIMLTADWGMMRKAASTTPATATIPHRPKRPGRSISPDSPLTALNSGAYQ